ncbi:hypothetical protein G6F57_008758 [Rhizopus arrhizus]|jgi:uncharacterized Rmd1/YagE family protein|uniref:Uncharacterized protein n=1 Tax=Rhizopus oryzae TaxID=64495 RepID=A0A9P6X4W3_RHIOR|nr:hypothetical protein G6F24_006549 [Rhizopus arrhizus]KAG0786937.1 hypothetical protein G6F21_008247 [Rhizopus arrhizus]KAG0817100.1 hypothetical protein G6F20_002654 [Rhizopus arrhizus]KAG0828939.1 hypothetical protein G6F18_008829 [Rhizopus arrhizus]KAG0843637.1 hypothetical protein G6F19_000379 [Rhizopus arrhizus]
MQFKKYIISLFTSKSKSEHKTEPINEPKIEPVQDESKKHKKDSIKDRTGIDEGALEFEESRNLLHSNIFHSSIDQNIHFPQFEHLLVPQMQVIQKQPKKISLRHRLSVHRPDAKLLKKAISTPDLFFKRHKEGDTKSS